MCRHGGLSSRRQRSISLRDPVSLRDCGSWPPQMVVARDVLAVRDCRGRGSRAARRSGSSASRTSRRRSTRPRRRASRAGCTSSSRPAGSSSSKPATFAQHAVPRHPPDRAERRRARAALGCVRPELRRRRIGSTSTTRTRAATRTSSQYRSNGTTGDPVIGEAAAVRQGLRLEPQRRPAAVRADGCSTGATATAAEAATRSTTART